MSAELFRFPIESSERVYQALDDFAKDQLDALWITPDHPDLKTMKQLKEQGKDSSLPALMQSVQQMMKRSEKWPNKYPLTLPDFAQLELYLEKRGQGKTREGPTG